MQHDATTCLDRFFKNSWHGAEAYHFWLLSHRHLYAGRYEQAMQVGGEFMESCNLIIYLNLVYCGEVEIHMEV